MRCPCEAHAHVNQSSQRWMLTTLKTAAYRQVVQRQQVPFNQPWEVLLFHLRRLFDDVKLISETTTRPGDDDTKATPASAKKSSQKSGGGVEEAARVLNAVDVRRASEGLVSVEWESNPVNDLVADSIVCVMMQVRLH